MEGKLSGKELRFGIVVSRINKLIANRLLDEVLNILYRHEVTDKNIFIVWTPREFEIPLVAKKLAESKKYDALIYLGVAVKDENDLYECICDEVSKGISQISFETGIPIIFGLVMAENIEQAIKISEGKGESDAIVAIEIANLLKQI